jgi:hypothetical protein
MQQAGGAISYAVENPLPSFCHKRTHMDGFEMRKKDLMTAQEQYLVGLVAGMLELAELHDINPARLLEDAWDAYAAGEAREAKQEAIAHAVHQDLCKTGAH